MVEAHDARNAFRASMRPRVFPAEDSWVTFRVRAIARCFNEAAGIPRGRRTAQACAKDSHARFNEAAGIPRGRLSRRTTSLACSRFGFNEAAGIPRGRLVLIERGFYGDRASMRPRVFPAEDGPLATPCDHTMFTTGLREVGDS